MLDELLTYDQELLIYINNLGEIHFDSFWIFVTNFIYWVPLLLFVFYKIYKKLPKHQAQYIISYGLFILFFSLVLVEIIKTGVERIRPCNDPMVAPFINIIIKPENYSFFSGHATVSFALTTYLYLTLRKVFSWIVFLYIWPLFFMYSRLYFGVHYPSDILIGMLVGISIGIVFYRIYNARTIILRIN